MRRRDLLLAMLGGALGCGRSRESDPKPTPTDDSTPIDPIDPIEPDDPLDPDDPLGPLDDVPLALRPAFDLRGQQAAPSSAKVDELAQSYPTFVAEQPPRPEPNRQTLAILPIGEYPRGFVVEYDRVHLVRSPEPELLARFCAAWFGLPSRVLSPIRDELLEQMPTRERDGRRQLDASAMLSWLQTQRPPDCFSVIALTLEDLYEPGTAWLFGYASVRDRVGVHSMLRYDPGFASADDRPSGFEQTILTRALRVIVHETGHMLGLRHCVHFACLMNSTAGLADLDALPLELCPVCLRKLWHATHVDLGQRWRALEQIAIELGLDADAHHYATRAMALAK